MPQSGRCPAKNAQALLEHVLVVTAASVSSAPLLMSGSGPKSSRALREGGGCSNLTAGLDASGSGPAVKSAFSNALCL